jgi:hypothetical protein
MVPLFFPRQTNGCDQTRAQKYELSVTVPGLIRHARPFRDFTAGDFLRDLAT